jgi:hypothetical protein
MSYIEDRMKNLLNVDNSKEYDFTDMSVEEDEINLEFSRDIPDYSEEVENLESVWDSPDSEDVEMVDCEFDSNE